MEMRMTGASAGDEPGDQDRRITHAAIARIPRIATAVFFIAARPDGSASPKSIIHPVRHQMRQAVALIGTLATIVAAAPIAQKRQPEARQAPAGVDPARLDEIPAVVEQAIAEKKLPGAVVLVGRGDRVVYQTAIGQRALEPA